MKVEMNDTALAILSFIFLWPLLFVLAILRMEVWDRRFLIKEVLSKIIHRDMTGFSKFNIYVSLIVSFVISALLAYSFLL